MIKIQPNQKAMDLLIYMTILSLLLFFISIWLFIKSKKPDVFHKSTYYYNLEENKNGITCFTINSDSTVSAEYILNKKVYDLNSVIDTEYERIIKNTNMYN